MGTSASNTIRKIANYTCQ